MNDYALLPFAAGGRDIVRCRASATLVPGKEYENSSLEKPGSRCPIRRGRGRTHIPRATRLPIIRRCSSSLSIVRLAASESTAGRFRRTWTSCWSAPPALPRRSAPTCWWAAA